MGIKQLSSAMKEANEYKFTVEDIDIFFLALEESCTDIVNRGVTQGADINLDEALKIDISACGHHITVPAANINYISLYNFLMECREQTVEINDK